MYRRIFGFPFLSAACNRNVSVRYRPINRFLCASAYVRGSTRTQDTLDPTGTGHPLPPVFFHRIWTNPVTRSDWGWGHVPMGAAPMGAGGHDPHF